MSKDVIESLREIIAAKDALIDTQRPRIDSLERQLHLLQRKFATFVLDVWETEGNSPTIPDAEVKALVDACVDLPKHYARPLYGNSCATCRRCGRRAPLKLEADEFVCAWGCLP